MLIALLIAIVLLQILDAWTTIQVLKAGGTELNAIMANMMRVMGRDLAVILLKFVAAAIAGVLYWQHQQLALVVLTAFYILVVANNLIQMRRLHLI